MESEVRLSSSGVRLSGATRFHTQAADDAEASELIGLARSLRPRASEYQKALDSLTGKAESELDASARPIERERVSERFARALRQLWLEASAFSTSSSYRSPPTDETTKTATGRTVEFGYERDLHPEHLEERCRAFFEAPPRGWRADHVLLSSGQSAMAAILHALEGSTLFGERRQLSFLHLGSYFETAEIASLFGSFLHAAGRGRGAVEQMERLDGDIVIVEPVFCDGEYGVVGVDRMLAAQRKRPRVYLFDTTLSGFRVAVEPMLSDLERTAPLAVFRIFSGIKLFQQGLELSSVGIVSVFTRDGAAISAHEIGERIRRVRTLLGLGLSFFEVAALEVPWFLDRARTDAYERAVFHNNARLAHAVAANNRLFQSMFHPALVAGSDDRFGAPYCSFRLREREPALYDALEQFIHDEARRRDLQFDLGGSFGFRGHRFEVVRPETGEEPFLRVALGRRTGWSRDRILELMATISRATSVRELTAASLKGA
jgi:hypothetical protein